MPDKMSQEKIGAAARLRRRGRSSRPRRWPPIRPRATTGSPTGSPRRSPAPSSPTSTGTRRTPQTHYETTGPEIWDQTDGTVDVFVAGVGTGGTISGVGRYLKERNPDVMVVGADPEGSVYSGDEPRPYLVEGIGEDFWPGTFDPEVVDRYVKVSDRDSFLTARAVTRQEGILVGGSCGTGGLRRAAGGARARRRHDRRGPAARHRPPVPVQGLLRLVDAAVRHARAARR